MLKNTIFFLILSAFMFSCGSDDDCTAESVMGTYNGTSLCTDPSAEGPTFVTVTGTGNNLRLEDSTGQMFDVTLNGCDFTIAPMTIDFFGVMVTVDGGGTFDGDDLDVVINSNVAGAIIMCTFAGTR